jgi:hypothetical protein
MDSRLRTFAMLVILVAATLGQLYLRLDIGTLNGLIPGMGMQGFEQNETSLEELNSNPDRYLGETVYVSGIPDIALNQEDRYILHERFNRSRKVYVTDCEGFSTVADKVYVKGEFAELEFNSFFDYDRNLTEEERENIEMAEEMREKYNVSSPGMETPDKVYGIRCEEAISER